MEADLSSRDVREDTFTGEVWCVWIHGSNSQIQWGTLCAQIRFPGRIYPFGCMDKPK